MPSILAAEHFHDEAAAYGFVEARVWPNGPVCPHCGGAGRIGKLGGKSTRIGAYKCYQCRKPFTVKIGTIFEASHVAMHLWLQAIFLMSSSRKGISSNRLHRTLDVTLKTAWLMSHRIREAMRTGGPDPLAVDDPGSRRPHSVWRGWQAPYLSNDWWTVRNPMASGDRADTDRRPKPSGKKKKMLSQKEQSERFVETARTLEADESGAMFDRAAEEIMKTRRRPPA